MFKLSLNPSSKLSSRSRFKKFKCSMIVLPKCLSATSRRIRLNLFIFKKKLPTPVHNKINRMKPLK